jgi:hypothetical protein
MHPYRKLTVVLEIERVDVALWPSGTYKSVEASSYLSWPVSTDAQMRQTD